MSVYSSLAVANYFIHKAKAANQYISLMKLLKLVYYAHGWHLGLGKGPLLDETIEAWKYGPAIRTVYEAFKGYGDQPILHGVTQAKDIWSEDAVQTTINGQQNPQIVNFLDKIWDVYGKYSALQLSEMSHIANGPWGQVSKEYRNNNQPLPRGLDIPDSVIAVFFKEQHERNQAANKDYRSIV